MNCPACQAGTDVVDSRPLADGSGIRRRRRCRACGRRLTTFELVEGADSRHQATVRAFARDLRATIARFEAEAAPYRNERRRTPGPKPRAPDASPLSDAVPVAAPVAGLRDRLKARREAEA